MSMQVSHSDLQMHMQRVKLINRRGFSHIHFRCKRFRFLLFCPWRFTRMQSHSWRSECMLHTRALSFSNHNLDLSVHEDIYTVHTLCVSDRHNGFCIAAHSCHTISALRTSPWPRVLEFLLAPLDMVGRNQIDLDGPGANVR